MSPQRPLHRAYQQDPQAVRAVEEGDLSRRSGPPREAAGAVIYFADEAGIRSDYHAGTTWSPVGQTPEVKNTGTRYLGEHDLRGVRERRAAVRRL